MRSCGRWRALLATGSFVYCIVHWLFISLLSIFILYVLLVHCYNIFNSLLFFVILNSTCLSAAVTPKSPHLEINSVFLFNLFRFHPCQTLEGLSFNDEQYSNTHNILKVYTILMHDILFKQYIYIILVQITSPQFKCISSLNIWNHCRQ